MAQLKPVLNRVGISRQGLLNVVGFYSLRLALKQNSLVQLYDQLKKIEPDISDQLSFETSGFNPFWELKRRALQAFQCQVAMKIIGALPAPYLTIVDIGDSSGRHLHYLRTLAEPKKIRGIGVNLDERAMPKIQSRGIEAIHCRAEDLNIDEDIDFFMSFEMLEHLHNPSLFLRRLSRSRKSKTLLVTVPYVSRSRIGLGSVRLGRKENVRAEAEHIFELSPEDWQLLFLHSGWRVRSSLTYYQYPTGIPLLSLILKWFWTSLDYEGFWAAELEQDLTISDRYLDWED